MIEKLSSVETRGGKYGSLNTIIRFSDEQFEALQNEINREIEFVKRMAAFAQAGRRLADYEPEIYGDVFGIGKSLDIVEKSLDGDNVWDFVEDVMYGAGGFDSEHPALSSGDGSFGVKAIDLLSKKLVIEGVGQPHPVDGYISRYALIVDSKRQEQEVEVHIVEDFECDPDISAVTAVLKDSLRLALPSTVAQAS